MNQQPTTRTVVVSDDNDLEGGGVGLVSSSPHASALDLTSGGGGGAYDPKGKGGAPPPLRASSFGLSAPSSTTTATSSSSSVVGGPNHNADLRGKVLLIVGATLFACFFATIRIRILVVVIAACAFGGVASLWLSRDLLGRDDGTPEMRAVSDPIREGAAGFLKVQYTAIARISIPLTMLIVISYQFRPAGEENTGLSRLGNTSLGVLSALAFCFGAVCSAAAGYVSMWVAARSNVRVTDAARRSYAEALVVCFRGGAFSATLNLTLCLTGVTSLYTVVHALLVDENTGVDPLEVPMLLVGYGFGASFVALYMQLGGGIYTKAADVGADLVGKVERDIPEDDPRNPAVIADLVGDMVGDCVGSSADVFESVAAEIIGAMILGGTLARDADLEEDQAIRFLLFPLVVHAMDILVSSAGIAFVGDSSLRSGRPDANPMVQLQKGYRVALGLSVVGFFLITRNLLEDPANPGSGFLFFLCGVVGMACAYIIVLSTQYYTDYDYYPVQSIAEASTTGHGTNIIVGVSVGMKATFVPSVTVAVAVLTAYHLGRATGIGEGRNAGLFGTAVATMGMLSNAVYILSMNNYGPIADNAGGIAEMSMQPEHVREATDRLDAAGNVTKAITKGYSIGSASMACFLLFGAFMDEFSHFSGIPFTSVNISTPEVLVGGLIGSMIIFYFTGLAIAAVGRTAHEVVIEVRRQFRENPGIMTYESRPDYARCVSLVTEAALREMQFPAAVCVVTPVAVGLVFRFVGEATDRPLLGAEVLAAYLMFGTVTGILMALFLDTAGGAWDNAKKYVEMGHHGGKGSEAHKAAVTGDTVGDPFKDTAGPSLHVVIKLLSTTILVAGPLFIARVD